MGKKQPLVQLIPTTREVKPPRDGSDAKETSSDQLPQHFLDASRNPFGTTSSEPTSDGKYSDTRLIWKGKQPPPRNSRNNETNVTRMNRSTTNTSEGSSKTNKSTSSCEESSDGLCSFVHSTGSISSLSAPNLSSSSPARSKHDGLEWKIETEANSTSPTGDCGSPISKRNSVQIAIQNFEEIIELTREASDEVERKSKTAAARSKTRTRRSRQLSQKAISVSEGSPESSFFSTSFVSAMDEHLASRRPNRLPTGDSIEVRKATSQDHQTGVLSTEAQVLVPEGQPILQPQTPQRPEQMQFISFRSPSTINGLRRSRSPAEAATWFVTPPSPTWGVPEREEPNRTKEQVDKYDSAPIFSEGESNNESQEESFEVVHKSEPKEEFSRHRNSKNTRQKHQRKRTHTQRINKKKQQQKQEPYQLVRVEESNAIEVLRQSNIEPRHSPKALSTAKKVLKLMSLRRHTHKKSPSHSASEAPSNKLVNIDEDNSTGAIELLRSNSTIVPTTAPISITRGTTASANYLSDNDDDQSREDNILVDNTAAPSSPLEENGKGNTSNTCTVDNDHKLSYKIAGTCVSTPTLVEEKMSIEIKVAKTLLPINNDSRDDSSSSDLVEEAFVDDNMPLPDAAMGQSAASLFETSENRPSSCLDDPHSLDEKASNVVAPLENEVRKSVNDNSKHASSLQQHENGPTTKSPAIPVPKIPAPKKDTVANYPTNYSNTTRLVTNRDQSSEDSDNASVSTGKVRQVKIQVHTGSGDGNNINNIEVSPSVASLSDSKLAVQEPDVKQGTLAIAKPTNNESTPEKGSGPVVKDKKYTTMVVKPLQGAVSTKPVSTKAVAKHVVRVNVLGVAGIVVDRNRCRDVTGYKLSPAPPEQMKALVGISEPGRSVDNVSAFSGSLIHAPMVGKERNRDDTSQRHIAVWASSHLGETPGSIVESNVLETDIADSASRVLNLNVALAKSDHDWNHHAVVIGAAQLEITNEMMSDGDNRTIDLPVQTVAKDGPLSSNSNTNSLIKLRSTEERKGIRKLLCEKVSDWEDANQGRVSHLTAAYAIDPTGDSMIRIQVRVEEVHTSTDQEKIKRFGSFANRTAATEETDDSSLEGFKNAFDPADFIGGTPSNSMDEGLYSKPVELPSDFDEDEQRAFQTVSWKEKLLKNQIEDIDEDPGCRVFGRNISIPSCTSTSRLSVVKHFDDGLENIADQVFDTNQCAGIRSDEDLFSLDRNETVTTMENYTEYADSGVTLTTREEETVTAQKLLEEMKEALGPVPSMTEMKSFAKELALTSGEYFFSKKVRKSENGVDGDNASVGSATPSAVLTSEESLRKKQDDDNKTHSTVSYESEANRFSETKFDIDDNDAIITAEEEKTLDSYQAVPVARNDGYKGDDEESTLRDSTALMNEVVEEDENEDARHAGNRGDDKPSLPSVVENIAEVLSIQIQPCSFFGTKEPAEVAFPNGTWDQNSVPRNVPQTVDPSDELSIGELTATSLEKDEIYERNRKFLMSKLRLPTDIFSRRNASPTPDDEQLGNHRQLVHRSSSVSNQDQSTSENYFSDYEDGASGVTSIYDNSRSTGSNSTKQTKNEQRDLMRRRSDEVTKTSTTGETGASETNASLQRIEEEEDVKSA